MINDDYKGSHATPNAETGSPLHNLSLGAYPEDLYHKQGFNYYGDQGASYDKKNYDAIVANKNKPDNMVLIHRAIPSDIHSKLVKNKKPLINPGDWVTTSKEYAQDHGEATSDGNYKIASQRVPAKHLFNQGDSLHEWGYHPTKINKYAQGGPIATNHMHHATGHRIGESTDIRDVGINEAADMPVKSFVSPPVNQNLHEGRMPGGSLPIGGIDVQPNMPGALGKAPQQQAQAQPAMDNNAIQSNQRLPSQGAPVGQPPSNMLQATQGGRMLHEMASNQQPKGLAKGGQPKAHDALAHHLSLGPVERAVNSVGTAHKIGGMMGFSDHNGRPKDILSQNSLAYGVKLPDGRGVETAGLSMSPDSPFEEHKAKHKAYQQDPHSFAIKLHDEIESAKQLAAHNGNHLGVRLGVTSTGHPHEHKNIIKAHPDVSFYDYTHKDVEPVAPNHHLTQVSNGINHGANNTAQLRKHLRQGGNASMTFSHRETLPMYIHDQTINKSFKVIDGDEHDFRPIDEPGTIVGHRNKLAKGSHQSHIPYDPTQSNVVIIPRQTFNKG